MDKSSILPVPCSVHSRGAQRPCSTEGQPLFWSDDGVRLLCELVGVISSARGHLGLQCKNSVHSHLGVCEDSLDGVSQLKFSLERRFSRTRYAFVPHFWKCTDAQRDSLYGGQFRKSHHIFVAEKTDGLDLISRGDTSVVCALICNV